MSFLRHRPALLAATIVVAGLAMLVPALLVPTQAAARPGGPPKPPPTEIRNATVHDPDHILVDGTHYVFGSHLQSASSPDLINFDQLSAGVNADNPLFDDVTTELSEALTWAQSDTLWAPDVIKLDDGRYYMYYDACKGDSPRSALGVAVADRVTGPYRDLGLILKSGMWGEPSEDGKVYDAKVHPNVVDPDVFFDRSGKLWMVYGSYSGGIFILELDPATAKPFPGQGYGKHLWGGNHARIEGPAVMFDSGTGYYYLYVTYGGLDASGGYNVRVARSKQPDGPYLDAQGRDMATVKADPDLPLFDDASIAPTGVKLMGNYQFQRVVGDPGTGLGVGAVSPGGSTHWYDPKTKQWYLIFHSRFPGRGEEHEVRVHRLEFTRSGWPVVAPYRYAGERSARVKRSDQVGAYALIDHGPKTISADIHQARTITLRPDGRITGAVTGRWHVAGQGKDGQSSAVLVVDGVRYEAVFDTGWDPDARRWVTTFSGLSDDGVALWGAQRTLVAPVTAVRRVVADLSLPAETAKDLALPTEGTQGSTISWASSDPAHLATDGTVTRPGVGEPDAQVRLAATIRNHRARAIKELTVTVPAREAGGLVAHYAFDGGLTADGGAGAGRVVGPRIGTTGSQVSYAAGVDGQAVVLDGQSGVQLPDGLVSGATYSVSLWLRPAAYSAYTPAFFAARDSEHWVSLLPQGSTGVGGNSMIWSGTEWYDAGFGQKLPLDEWSHVAFTVDSGRLTAWVDGKQVFSGTGFPDVLTTDTGVFSLGVNWWDTPFKGAIDDLRVYDSVLTDAEVAALATR